MSVTQDVADERLKASWGGTPYVGQDTYYAELVYGSPDRTTPGTPSGLGRIPVSYTPDVTDNGDGTGSNATIWTWADPGVDVPECGYLELWTLSVGGTRKFFEMLSAPVTPVAGQAVQIPIGNFNWGEV
jgi:hypothetical protein